MGWMLGNTEVSFCVCMTCYKNQLLKHSISGWQGSRKEGGTQDVGEGLGLGAGGVGRPMP